MNGKQSALRSVSAYKIKPLTPKSNAENIKMSERNKELILNRTIKEVVTYKDSVAAVITSYIDSLYIFQ
jgi:hypothetical protein